MRLVAWGCQEAREYIAKQAASAGGGKAIYTDRTNALVQELTRILDEPTWLCLMAEIEDEVLRSHWAIPFYDASAVYGYSDRVLAHPVPEDGAHFTDLNRIVLKK
jgi:hypothetical protein